MNTLKNAYQAEIFKAVGPYKKRLIKFIIAILIITIVFTALYSLINKVLNDFGLDTEDFLVNSTDYDEALNYLETEYKEYLEQQKALESRGFKIGKLLRTEKYKYEANIAKYKFLKENNVPIGSFRDFGSFSIDGVGYFSYMADILLIAFIIFSIVQVSSLIAGETSSGAMKMQLIRPISRDKLLAAKYLTVQTITGILYLLAMIFVMVIGLIFFGASSKKVLVVLNANHVFIISSFLEMIIVMIYGWFSFSIIIQVTTFFATYSNGKAATALPIVLFLLGSTIDSWLAYIYVGYIGINSNLNWLKTLTLEGPPFRGMNIYSMIIISVFWAALATFGAHVLFNRKDVQS